MATKGRSSTKSSVASGVSTPTFSLRRYDHLIGEQLSVVKNTQEDLKQAIIVLKRANSKEEQESAKLQVEALLSRSEELLTKLQVTTAIQKELSSVQQEIVQLKKRKKDITQHQERQQWLEKRIQGLLLTRYRGRPVARGRKPVVPQQVVSNNQPLRRGQEEGKQDGITRGAGVYQTKQSQTFRGHHRHHSIATTISDITSIGCTTSIQSSAGHFRNQYSDTDEDDEDNGDDDVEEEEEEEEDEDEDEELPTRNQNKNAVVQASTESDQDSDEWFSESEANWTIADAYSMKDFKAPAQDNDLNKQEKSSCDNVVEPTTEAQTTPTKINNSESSFSSVVYPFEQQRSVSLFGVGSWNVLNLATFANYVETDHKDIHYSQHKDTDQLKDLLFEISSLCQLVQSTSRAMTLGQRLPLISARRLKRTNSTHMTSAYKRRSDSDPGKKNSELLGTLPRLPPIKTFKGHHTHFLKNNVYTPTANSSMPSRRVFGQNDITQFFPQPTNKWCSEKIASLHTNSSCGTAHKNEQRHVYTRRNKQSSGTCDLEGTLTDVLESNKHQTLRITLLKNQLNSSSAESRKDAIQSLSHLSMIDEETVTMIMAMLVNDPIPQVRYEVLKAMIKQGLFCDTVLVILNSALKHACIQIKSELLSILEEKRVNESLLKAKGKHFSRLYETLYQLMTSNEDSHVSLTASIVLSRLGLYQEALKCLTEIFNESNEVVVDIAFKHLEILHNWKDRLCAINILRSIGERILTRGSETILQYLLKRLPCEPIQAVRKAIGCLLGELKLGFKAECSLLKKLQSSEEVKRAQAIIALAALENMEKGKLVNILLDSLELDPSVHVKIHVVRALSALHPPSMVTISMLQHQSKGPGLLAIECKKALQKMTIQT